MTGTYSAGETMTVNVNSKHDPIVSGDSVWASQLKEGDQVRIRLSKQPIKVVASLRPQN
jgi:NAD kinase